MKNGPFAIEKPGLGVRDPTETMVQTRLRVLGRFSLELGHVTAPSLGTQKARAVLAYLVMHRESDVARERLLELFWPQATPDAAKDGLRAALWSIRRSIRDAGFDPDDYLVANRAVVRWKARSWLDAQVFLELSQSNEPSDLEASLDLYKGDFLEGDYEEWTASERAQLEEAYELVLSRLVRTSRSHEAAQILLSRNPYDEPSYLLLIEDDLSAGRVVAAAALAERCERALAEIGTQPSEALRKLALRISVRQAQTVARPELPFVGRERELAIIRTQLADRAAGRLLIIHGEAGIGKSALLSHAEELARACGIPIVRMRCFDTDGRPFGAFEELYATLYGSPFNPLLSSDRHTAGAALAEAILSRLDGAGVLSIDDAQALSTVGRSTLSKVASQACARGMVLLLAVRSEGVSDVLSACSGCPLESIALGALDFEDLRVAVDSVMVTGADVVATTLYERSGGHPLFAATLLDSLAQSGILRADQGAWRLAGVLDGRVPLPKTLAKYIDTRLHARGKTAAAVAAALSLEPAATVDDIRDVLQISDESVSTAIDELLALGVLAQRASGPQLAFVHDLYREVAATTLNPGKRARLHRMFAERFACSSSPESSLRTARHLSLAGEALGAAQAYCRAAAAALEWGATMEALERCNAGIALIEDLEHTSRADAVLARLEMLSAKAQAALGDSGAAITIAGEAIAFAKRAGETGTTIEAALIRQRALLDDYDAHSVLTSAREIATMARATADSTSLAIALSDESWALRLLGNESEAVRAAREAQGAAEATQDHDLFCYALVQQILAGVTWWRFDDAIDAATRGVREMMDVDRTMKAALQTAIACLYLACERRDKAATALSSAEASLQTGEASKRYAVGVEYSQARLCLELHSTLARLALFDDDVDRALTIAEKLETMASARARPLGSLFRADALFEVGHQGPAFTVSTEAGSGLPFLQDVYSGSRSPQLAEMLNAVTRGESGADDLVMTALDRVEAAARRAPLEADRAFRQLARAAEKCNLDAVAVRATLRSHDYRNARELASSSVAS